MAVGDRILLFSQVGIPTFDILMISIDVLMNRDGHHHYHLCLNNEHQYSRHCPPINHVNIQRLFTLTLLEEFLQKKALSENEVRCHHFYAVAFWLLLMQQYSKVNYCRRPGSRGLRIIVLTAQLPLSSENASSLGSTPTQR